LEQFDTLVLQHSKLARGFYAFGDDPNRQLAAHRQNAFDNHLTPQVRVNVANQRHVQFDEVGLDFGQ
jgi:hypothetical protein